MTGLPLSQTFTYYLLENFPLGLCSVANWIGWLLRFFLFLLLLIFCSAQPLIFAASNAVAQIASGSDTWEVSQSSPLQGVENNGAEIGVRARTAPSSVTIPLFSGGQSVLQRPVKRRNGSALLLPITFHPLSFAIASNG